MNEKLLLQDARCNDKDEVLLSKLEFYGIAGNVHALIRPYLSGRYQRVLRNTEKLYLHTSSD